MTKASFFIKVNFLVVPRKLFWYLEITGINSNFTGINAFNFILSGNYQGCIGM